MATETLEQEPEATPEDTAHDIEDSFAKEFEQAAPVKQKASKEPDSPDDKAEPEGDGLEEIEHEGATYRVPAPLKEAFIHKADYTQKTQAVAEKQRAIELQSEQMRVFQIEREFEQIIAEPLNNLNLIESRTKLLLANWATLSAEDKQEILYLDKQKEQIVHDINGKKAEFDKGLQKSLGELRTKAQDAVKKAIPNWSDALAKDITEHAISEGYTNQELSSITDPRHMKTLWKAREYDRLKTAAKATPAKVAVVKTGASIPMPKNVQDKLTFRKELGKAQTPSQKARLIEEKFTREFGGRRS